MMTAIIHSIVILPAQLNLADMDDAAAAHISPYRVNVNYRPPRPVVTTTESSDRGYSTMTAHDDVETSSTSCIESLVSARIKRAAVSFFRQDSDFWMTSATVHHVYSCFTDAFSNAAVDKIRETSSAPLLWTRETHSVLLTAGWRFVVGPWVDSGAGCGVTIPLRYIVAILYSLHLTSVLLDQLLYISTAQALVAMCKAWAIKSTFVNTNTVLIFCKDITHVFNKVIATVDHLFVVCCVS